MRVSLGKRVLPNLADQLFLGIRTQDMLIAGVLGRINGVSPVRSNMICNSRRLRIVRLSVKRSSTVRSQYPMNI